MPGRIDDNDPDISALLYSVYVNNDEPSYRRLFHIFFPPLKRFASCLVASHRLKKFLPAWIIFGIILTGGLFWISYGAQPGLTDAYITTGSLYLCSDLLLPIGLPATDEFWSGPPEPWTARKIWSGMDIPGDHSID